jgi:hypothetical protein
MQFLNRTPLPFFGSIDPIVRALPFNKSEKYYTLSDIDYALLLDGLKDGLEQRIRGVHATFLQ